MFKNVVSLSLKLAMTTAHGHTVGTDAERIDDDGTMVHAQKSWVITHIWPHEPPTAPYAVSADHHAACIVEATATLHARSDASSGCDSFVQI